MELQTIQQKIANIIAANKHLYRLTSPEIIVEHAYEKITPVIRKKRCLYTEEITKEISAIPNYVKNIINNIVKYVNQHKKYPTTQVQNIFVVRTLYPKYNKSQRIHYQVLPEWETYLKLLNYYETNKVKYISRDYSLDMLRKFKQWGVEMFELTSSQKRV